MLRNWLAEPQTIDFRVESDFTNELEVIVLASTEWFIHKNPDAGEQQIEQG